MNCAYGAVFCDGCSQQACVESERTDCRACIAKGGQKMENK